MLASVMLFLAPAPSLEADMLPHVKGGFEACIVYEAADFANAGVWPPRDAVKAALVRCASDMNRLLAVWRERMREEGVDVDADPRFHETFNRYVTGYCATVETVMINQTKHR